MNSQPMAVASQDDEGVAAAIAWCAGHLTQGATLSVWTAQRGELDRSPVLSRLITDKRAVQHIVRRGGGSLGSSGPVLMAWAGMDDIAHLQRAGSRRMTALAVIAWGDSELRPWVAAAQPDVLGNQEPWTGLTVDLHPLVVAALDGLTVRVNPSSTIAASGFYKDLVVSTLLALHAAGIPLHPRGMQGWVLAHGWSGDNPKQLAAYARGINNGKRPRARNVLRPDYVERLRQEVAEGE